MCCASDTKDKDSFKMRVELGMLYIWWGGRLVGGGDGKRFLGPIEF